MRWLRIILAVGGLLAVVLPGRAQHARPATAEPGVLLQTERPARGVLRHTALDGLVPASAAEEGPLIEFLRRGRRDGGWVDEVRVRFAYDAGGVPQGWVLERWDTTAWVPQQRQVFVHDARGQRIEETTQVWSDGAWQPLERSLLAYDARGHLVEQELQQWAAGAWSPVLRLQNTYGPDDRRETGRIDRWIDGRWEPEEADRLVYDARGNLVERRLLRWNGSDWVGRVRDYTVYNDADRPVERIRQVWSGSEWVPCLNCRRSRYTYDARGRLVEEHVQYWIGTWVDLAREQYAIDTRGHVVERIGQTHTASFWQNYDRHRYAYDARGREVERISELWLGGWVSRYQDLSTYAPGGEALPATARIEGAYPNPFGRATLVAYFLPETQPVRLSVYDLLGREVARLVDGPQPPGRHEVPFDAAGLPAGTYLCRLQAGGRASSHTVVRLR